MPTTQAGLEQVEDEIGSVEGPQAEVPLFLRIRSFTMNCLWTKGSLPNLDDEVRDPLAEPRSGVASVDCSGVAETGPVQFRLKSVDCHGLPPSPSGHAENRMGAL